jgi:hypothetical protein
MLYRLLKNVVKWVSNLGQGIADAEDRMVKSMFKDRDNNESN